MDPKSAVVKSKSSNSGISKKSKEDRQDPNKKSRSSAGFPHHGIKKRGVYVEKRLTKINLANDKKPDTLTKKPLTRPQAGQKKFLTSVLTILSKYTTGTQYPETNDDENEQTEATSDIKDKGYKHIPCAKRNKANNKDVANKTNYKINDKEKLKSRVLRKKFVREDNKKMVVLQSRKEIIQTPSNYSEWSYKDGSQRSNTSNILNRYHTEGSLNITDDLKNAILEGRNITKGKKLRYLDDEPKTLVCDEPIVQKNLYNFFVDLLETTISVYNVTTEYDGIGLKDVSKTELQINESVANILNINKEKLTTEPENDFNLHPQNLNIENETNNEDLLFNTKTKLIAVKPPKQELRFNINKPKKLKTNSFIYPIKTKTMPKKSNSVEINHKTKFKNKNDLINSLKQELQLDTHVFEQPKNIFQALRVMARNKKKITFDPKTFTDECIMRRQKVISSRKRKKNKNNKPSNILNKPIKTLLDNNDFKYDTRKKFYDYNTRRYNKNESYHSIEVIDIDYESNQSKTTYLNHDNDITLTYHSSNSELDFDVNDAILNPVSEYSIRMQ